MTRLIPTVLVCAAAVIGCAEPITEIIVVVDSDLLVPDELDAVRIVVESGRMPPVEVEADLRYPDELHLPLTYSLVPENDGVGEFTVVVTGLHAGADVVSRTATVTFVSGESLILRMDLRRICVGVACAPDTCVEGECVEPGAHQDWLSEWNLDPETTRLETCNGLDDDGDGMRDNAPAEILCPGHDNATYACEGACIIEACEGDWEICDGNHDNGCETWLLEDVNNCGSCGNVCAWDRPCVNATCDHPVELALGDTHSCVRTREQGQVFCWGDGSSGQLGNGTFSPSPRPVRAGRLSDVHVLTSGRAHTCAKLGDGTVWCWGANESRQLGRDTSRLSPAADPAPVVGVEGAGDVSAGDAHTCAIVGGSVLCWGGNDHLQLGRGAGTGGPLPPGVVPGLPAGAVSVAAGSFHTCAFLDNGEAWCWGLDDSRQLGRGDTGVSFPPPGATPLSKWVSAMSADWRNTAVLYDDYTVQVWGDNTCGQVGNGATGTVVPMPGIGPPSSYVFGVDGEPRWMLATGPYHTCAVGQDGRAYCWGWRGYGVLGDGFVGSGEPQPGECVPTPQEIPRIGSGVRGIDTAERHTCAISDDVVWCWGDNTQYQAGQPTEEAGLPPMPVPAP